MTAAAVRSIVAGTGAYLPARVLSNADLAQTLETSDLWIRDRTGIRQRHIAAPAETCAVMAAAAARGALADAGATPADVGAIIVATSTPDQAFPATALRVQAALGVPAGFGFDVAAACAGFVYALSLAESLIACGKADGVLVIGAEVYSRILNWTDRSTCVLFGDGAGATFLRKASSDEMAAGRGILSTHLHAQGSLGDILYVDGAVGLRERPGTLVMHGREVFRHAVVRLAEVVDEALAANGLDHAAVDWLVPAPGQPAHHRRHGPQAWPAAGTRRRHRRPACQYVGRLDPPGARPGPRRRARSHRRTCRHGSAWRRSDLGFGDCSHVA